MAIASLQLGLQVSAELILVFPLPISRVGLNPSAPNPHMLGDLFKRYFSRLCRQSSGREADVIVSSTAGLLRINYVLNLLPC